MIFLCSVRYIYIYKSSEKEEDPGLIVVYDVEAVHVALGHDGTSPTGS